MVDLLQSHLVPFSRIFFHIFMFLLDDNDLRMILGMIKLMLFLRIMYSLVYILYCVFVRNRDHIHKQSDRSFPITADVNLQQQTLKIAFMN